MAKKLFLTGSHGKLILVDTLGENPHIKDGIYFRYPEGGTDTTKPRFLFDIPAGLTTIEEHAPGESAYSD